MTVNSQIH